MSNKFIEQVESIVMSNLADENFGAKNLAFLLGLSNSQTLRKIKASTGKSATQYIRELRLKEAAKLIKKTDLTFSEISYKTGFASPSYFNKTFLKYYGITPSEFKARKINDEELASLHPKRKFFGLGANKVLLYVITILVLFTAGYLITTFQSKKKTSPSSIAVLPFKDFSPEDSQWFSDGVSDNILHSLAQMQDLSVISFTSSSTYRDTDKLIPQIAKELGVSYILEGSVTLVEGKIKVITQLIGANDEHIWSKEYNENFDDIISVQNNVAQEVMRQLEFTLSPQEENTLSKYPTENKEAYNLHLEGRRINQSVKYADLKKNIENNQKSIALDSNFVDAYVELAATNMILALEGYRNAPNYMKKAATYVDKALELDSNSAKANAVKARLLLGNDWSDSEIYFKKAIKLNPNDAEAHYWYADYFIKKDNVDLKQALRFSTIANQQSPFSTKIAAQYTWLLILNEKYEEAENFIKEYGFLLSDSDSMWLSIIAIGFKNKNWQPAVDWMHKQILKKPENAGLYNIALAHGDNTNLIDDIKCKEYAKKAFELNENYFFFYFLYITKRGFFKEAEKLMQTDFFKNLPEDRRNLNTWRYHYYKRDFKQAQKLIIKNPKFFRYQELSITYAQLGDKAKLDSINKIYFVHGEFKNYHKARIHAILKNRDSMYYYLNKTIYSYRNAMVLTNSYPEFDPYKNDPRYKALLRKWYAIIPGE